MRSGIVYLLGLLISTPAFAHGGDLDGYGCTTERPEATTVTVELWPVSRSNPKKKCSRQCENRAKSRRLMDDMNDQPRSSAT